jgi:hypothetical protein
METTTATPTEQDHKLYGCAALKVAQIRADYTRAAADPVVAAMSFDGVLKGLMANARDKGFDDACEELGLDLDTDDCVGGQP